EEVPAQETPAEEVATEETPAVDEAPPADDAPSAGEPPAQEDPEAPTTEEQPQAAEPEAPEAEPDPASAAPEAESPAPEESRRGRAQEAQSAEPEAIPGAHLEPDLVLDESAPDALSGRAGAEIQAAEESFAAESERLEDEPSGESADAIAPVTTTILDLAADARYQATGKRKRAVARVIIRPGSGVYSVNGRELNAFFPRPTLQRMARGPLETVGQQERMDVTAKIHGGGVSSQAAALRHGIARALVEADPNLRGELKRRGFLTRDPRVKERKKAGLKKARKRPQFSKR
ncbi:MAG: 30S ribosomal protein S9, partial [Thermoleophilaceae bacterium]